MVIGKGLFIVFSFGVGNSLGFFFFSCSIWSDPSILFWNAEKVNVFPCGSNLEFLVSRKVGFFTWEQLEGQKTSYKGEDEY